MKNIGSILGLIAFLGWVGYFVGPLINNVVGITDRAIEAQDKKDGERIEKLIDIKMKERFPKTTGGVVTNGSNK